YKILGLKKEPFSTSPDPDFFYDSTQHKMALYRLRVAIELRRGLSVILGDVGTGKTTLIRKLSQLLNADSSVIATVNLNPIYDTELQFLAELAQRFRIKINPARTVKVLDYMKVIEAFLFKQCVEQNKTVVLLIDEAQKLTEPCLEILRSLLNYETNEHKTLQLVLLGQMELLPRISRMANFWDRIAFKCVIDPLDENSVRELIHFRLHQAGYRAARPLFSDGAVKAVYAATQGYPRKITMLCHDALELLVMHDRTAVEAEDIQALGVNELKPVLV
ncbi:MAG: AAA family ATPase, partial [Candidatus Omnitrophica bacterium]|nr:AAA family ATPase [Candidatus Omnitrophota bacterium]